MVGGGGKVTVTAGAVVGGATAVFSKVGGGVTAVGVVSAWPPQAITIINKVTVLSKNNHRFMIRLISFHVNVKTSGVCATGGSYLAI